MLKIQGLLPFADPVNTATDGKRTDTPRNAGLRASKREELAVGDGRPSFAHTDFDSTSTSARSWRRLVEPIRGSRHRPPRISQLAKIN